MTFKHSIRRCFGLLALVHATIFILAASMSEQVEAAPPAQQTRPPSDQVCTTSTHSIKQLALIDSTSEGGFQCLGVDVEGGAVKAIRLERHNYTSGAGQPGSEQVKVLEFPASTVDSGSGAVIDGIPGHDAIVLRGRLSTSPGRAELVLSYLFNGLTGEFHSCPVTLDSTPRTGWRLINRYDQTISRIVVKIRRVPLFGTVGIENLEGACTLHESQAGAMTIPGADSVAHAPCPANETDSPRGEPACTRPRSSSFASGP